MGNQFKEILLLALLLHKIIELLLLNLVVIAGVVVQHRVLLPPLVLVHIVSAPQGHEARILGTGLLYSLNFEYGCLIR